MSDQVDYLLVKSKGEADCCLREEQKSEVLTVSVKEDDAKVWPERERSYNHRYPVVKKQKEQCSNLNDAFDQSFFNYDWFVDIDLYPSHTWTLTTTLVYRQYFDAFFSLIDTYALWNAL